MRVMADARLADQFYFPAELLVTFGEDAGVFLPRHYRVRVAINVEQRHTRITSGFKLSTGFLS